MLSIEREFFMKNRYTPYYNCSDCDDQERVNGVQNGLPAGMPFDFPTGMPTGPGGPFPTTMQGGPTLHPSIMQQQQQQQQQQPMGSQLSPIPASGQPQALTLQSLDYLNAFLRTQLGKKVRVEFLIGTGTLLDKSGTLLGVGANYIVLNQSETDDVLVCDFFSIKFITFYY